MKKKLFKLLFLLVVIFGASYSASAQIYVEIRPIIPVIVRSEPPSQEHVWIEEEWVPEGRSYRYVGSHWEAPPQRGYVRSNGYWKHSKHGDKWNRGGWKRGRR